MSFMEKVSNFFGLEDDEYMEDYQTPQGRSAALYQQTVAEKQPLQTRRTIAKEKTLSQRPASARTQEKKTVVQKAAAERSNQAVHHDTNRKVVALSQNRTQSKTASQAGKIMIVEPKAYSEAMKIARHVMNGEAVLVNFHLIEEVQARRIVDFLTGTVYAEDGDIKRVADEIFLCTPKDVEIEGAAQSLVESDLFDF